MTNQPLKIAVDWAGSKTRLAAALGVTERSVYGWMLQGWMPLPAAMHVETLTKGKIRAKDLVKKKKRRNV